jgi:hypothetical protein
MNKISFSQYGVWANCPWAWKLQYVDGHRTYENTIHTIFGTVMHEVIQDWLEILYSNENKAKNIYLHEDLKSKLLSLFKENVSLNEQGEKVFLSDKETLTQFYNQGCEILTYIQNNYKKIFPTKNVVLHSIEYELNAEVRPNIRYVGYIDIVTHDIDEDRYVLYDLKTSRTGWSSFQKSDPKKVNQLLLYKKFFAEQMQIDEKSISVEFVILKREVFESQFPVPRVSKFSPPNGKPSINKAWTHFTDFIDGCFDATGNYIAEQSAKPSKDNCRWCEFKNKKDLCPYGV